MKHDWQPITATEPREGERVLTRINDARGPRNETVLYRKGRLWFVPDGSFYVYYTPTEFAREIPAAGGAAPAGSEAGK